MPTQSLDRPQEIRLAFQTQVRKAHPADAGEKHLGQRKQARRFQNLLLVRDSVCSVGNSLIGRYIHLAISSRRIR